MRAPLDTVRDVAAPEAWAHIAISLMAQAELGANVDDVYCCSVVDAMFHDPETWGDYGPGYLAAVTIRAIREASRQGGLPSPGAFLSMCVRNRAWFRHAQARMLDLLEVRQNAEDILIKLGDNRLADLGVPCDDWGFE